MYKIYSIILVVLLGLNLFAVKGWGQDAPNLLSPQTRDFFHTVSHYTGTVNMSIPLYTYKDKDFEIPLTLSYNATGFIPSKREGPVGLNWALNAGGAVVRKVNGLPDDCSGKNEKGERVSPMGIWTGAKNRKLANLNKQDIFELKVGEAKDGYWTANDVELTPDEFTFVAPGLSGWFYINFDGTVKCAGNKPFVVELGGMGEQPTKGTKMAYSSITITADNGYKYVFGGGDAEKEWSINYNRGVLGTVDNKPKDTSAIITAWHLVSITAPSGRSVRYQYLPYIANTYHLYNTFYNQSGAIDARQVLPSAEIDKWKINVAVGIAKTVHLDRINIGTTSISFSYLKNSQSTDSESDTVRRSTSETNSTGVGPLMTDHRRVIGSSYSLEDLKVSGITIQYDGKDITGFQFNYTRFGNNPSRRNGSSTRSTGRLFLTSITEQQQLPYTFTYYIPENPFPNFETMGIDHWGFWNGKDDNISLIPAATNVEDDIQYTATIRDPDGLYCNAGLLESVTYPTKGSTTFFYEPNSYSQRLDRRKENDYLPELYEVNGIAGGARITAVKHTDGRNTHRVTYNYPIEGILMSWPRYALFYEQSRYDGIFGFLAEHIVIKGQAHSYAVNHYPGEYFIHYQEVLETRNTGNGYIKYTYANYVTTPDSKDFVSKQYGSTDKKDYLEQWRQLEKQYSSRYFERGLLTNMQVYDANNRLKVQQYLEYSGINDYSDEWIPSVAMGEFDANSYKIYHYPIALQRETSIQYFDGDSVVTVTDYDYHNRRDAYPVSKTTTASDGAALKTEYRYIDGWRDNAEYAALRARNIRNIPVETIHYKNGAVVGASLINFKFFDGLANWKVYPAEVLQLGIKAPVTDFDSVNVDRRLKPQVTYERYDNYGNVLQQRGIDGLTVSYLWDKSGLYKLAEVVGATYDELQKAAAGMNLEVRDSDYSQRLRTLREKLPQALITNYTYKPLVGITSQTDANGRTTYYEYDELNRLKRVRDHEGMVLKEYEVHYFEK